MTTTPGPDGPGQDEAGAGTGPAPDPAWQRVSRYDRRAEIVAVEELTPTGTVRIVLRVVDSGPFSFSPGHFVALREDVPGHGVRRSPYCIFSPPGKGRRFELLVRVFPEGPLSQHLASLGRGAPIHFRGPSGRSMVPRGEQAETELVLLATGVGISPFYSLCHLILAEGYTGRLRLYWGLRLIEDICLSDELDGLVARHPNFTYEISLSRPPSRWPGLRGRLTESVPPLLDALGGKRFYLSGNGAMVEEMELALTGLGVDRASIHEERFFNVRHRPDPGVMEAILARFVAHDLFSPQSDLLAHGRLFPLERDRLGVRFEGGDS